MLSKNICPTDGPILRRWSSLIIPQVARKWSEGCSHPLFWSKDTPAPLQQLGTWQAWGIKTHSWRELYSASFPWDPSLGLVWLSHCTAPFALGTSGKGPTRCWRVTRKRHGDRHWAHLAWVGRTWDKHPSMWENNSKPVSLSEILSAVERGSLKSIYWSYHCKRSAWTSISAHAVGFAVTSEFVPI